MRTHLPVALTAIALVALIHAPISAVPSAPHLNDAIVAGGTVTLTWTTPPGGVLNYRLEAGTAPGSSNAANTLVGNTNAFTTTGVPSGLYYVRVRAVGVDGDSAASNEITVSVGASSGCRFAPGAPTNLTATVSGSSVSFTWSPPVTGCSPDSYRLYAGSTAGATNLAAISVGALPSFAASAPNGTYYVHVVAYNPYGTSTASNVVTVTIGSTAPPATPTPSNSFGPGQWLINAQVAPGRYYADPVSGCYWERQRGLSGSLNDVIANQFVGFDARQIIVDIASSDVAFETDSDCGRWYTTPRHGAQNNIPPGMWLVNGQLTPGTYVVNAGPGCYWERLRGFSGRISDVIDNEFVSGGGQQLVSILSSDIGFYNDADCGTWTRIADTRDTAGDVRTPLDIELKWRANYQQESGAEPRPLVKK